MLLGFLSFWSGKQELLELNIGLPRDQVSTHRNRQLGMGQKETFLGWMPCERMVILKPLCLSLAPSLLAPEMSSCYHDPVFFGQVVT